jgi:hypothetical protein
MKAWKAALVVAGIYAASLLLFLLLLVAGLIAAGRSGASRAEGVLLLVLGSTGLGFAVGTGLVYRVLGRAGLLGGARLLAVSGYALLCGATLLVLFLVGALAFNR